MKPILYFVPIFALFGLAVVAPAYMHFLSTLSDMPSHIQFLAALTLPVLTALLGASWLQPGGS